MGVTLTIEGQEDQAAAMMAAKAANFRVGLFTSHAGSGKAVTLANINEATYSGYAEQTPAFTAGGEDAANRMQYTGAALTFAHNGGATANTINGWFMKDTSTGKLHYYEDYATPLTMSASGNTITVTPKLFYGDLTPPL